MEHFVTLFNASYLPQGIALHRSMELHVKPYVLWILCVDNETHDVLTRLNLPNVRQLKLSEFETPELLKVKRERTIGEYCWTLTPFAPRFVFDADSGVERVTYVDADIWFRQNPEPIFSEFEAASKSVLITDHAYAPEYDQSASSGKYCVQFMTFVRDGGEAVRKWWEERCVEWCFDRVENGKFGDQKYLDDWPTRFKDDVHVLENKDLILAPWNANIKDHVKACIYHFHGLRIIGNRNFILHGSYIVPRHVKSEIYFPYCTELTIAIENLRANGVLIPQSASLKLRLLLRKFLIFVNLIVQKNYK